jgi:hypothetical protein
MVEDIDIALVGILIDLVLVLIDDLSDGLLLDSYTVILIWVIVRMLLWAVSFVISYRSWFDLFLGFRFRGTRYTFIFEVLLFYYVGILDAVFHLAAHMILNHFICTQRSQLSHPTQFT